MPYYEDYIPSWSDRILEFVIGCFLIPFLIILFLGVLALEAMGFIDMGKPEDFEDN